jgi:hypothetical protein
MTKDYLGDRKASEQLAWRIKNYWLEKKVECNVWVEPFFMGETRLWQIRSDLKFRVTKRI